VTALQRLDLRALALPAGILALIVLMIVPVPAVLLDVSFVLNIALSVAILMAAMNAAKPLDFSSFPSVLLFATLLRLALNVASTRVVLVHGHEGEAAAGHVIEAFGAFLIGGNFAVGLFVFMILDDHQHGGGDQGRRARVRSVGAFHAGCLAGQADGDRFRSGRRADDR